MRRTAGLLVLTALAVACGGGVAEDGAAAAVQQFYEAINDAKYDAAQAFYGEETRAALSDPAIADENSFAGWAELETKDGTISEVRIVDSEVTEDGTSVTFEVTYRSGPPARRRVLVSEEGGAWKLGLISGV